VRGKQHVALTPGNISRATFQGEGTPENVIYGLGLAADDAKRVTIGERKMAWEQPNTQQCPFFGRSIA
jgi:hypothetical protein